MGVSFIRKKKWSLKKHGKYCSMHKLCSEETNAPRCAEVGLSRSSPQGCWVIYGPVNCSQGSCRSHRGLNSLVLESKGSLGAFYSTKTERQTPQRCTGHLQPPAAPSPPARGTPWGWGHRGFGGTAGLGTPRACRVQPKAQPGAVGGGGTGPRNGPGG